MSFINTTNALKKISKNFGGKFGRKNVRKNARLALGGAILLALVFLVFFVMQNIADKYVSTEVSGLPEALPMETVELKDGDTYVLSAGYVVKEINGVKYRMLAYNGSIPGPLLKIPQGAKVTIHFTNQTDMKTLLHSHGVRMENAFDGAQTAQKEMAPGESFDYVLKFPDAGVYWYHPHFREDYQQELGLYGNYLVTPKNPNYFPPVNREVTLFLDDILIVQEKTKGKILLSKEKADRMLMGRYGNVFLVNGETDYSLAAKKGEVVRLYLTNSANARPFNFAIEQTKLKLIGGDGGAYENAQWRDSLILAPSERAIVDVLFETEGTFEIQNNIPNRTDVLGTITVFPESPEPQISYRAQFYTLQTNRETKESIDPFREYFNLEKAPDKFIQFTLGMGRSMGEGMSEHTGHTRPPVGEYSEMVGMPMQSANQDGIEWEDMSEQNVSGKNSTSPETFRWKIVDEKTGKENTGIDDWVFKKNQPVKMRIFNNPNAMHAMDHPMHFHGQRFLVLARNGVKENNLVWKDTVLVPAGHTIDILLVPENPGVWMAHCHIAEHLEDGMMFVFRVEE